MNASFPAKYPGKCAGCGDRVHVDDSIRFDPATSEVIHADCDATSDDHDRPAVVCGTCWLTKPCGCDEL